MAADRRTDDEILAKSARDGDEQAFVELFLRYKGVVRSVSNGYFLAGGDREDLFAEGMLGLYTAIKDFDADKSNSFAAFAYLCILRRVISAVKQSGSNKNKALFNYIPLNDAVAEAVADTDSDPLERAILKEQQQSLENKIDTRLSAFEKERRICLCRDTLTRISRSNAAKPSRLWTARCSAREKSYRRNKMSYLALYRRYRPQTFDEMVGQDFVVTTLKNQIKSGQISHAYLFTGTRGTGKTTAAKVFSRAINCENPVDGNPCMKCRSCLDNGGMDIVELDAASNNGVEYIRDIKEKVQYAPSSSKYKVYIIDEVHMLSQSAFNAFLKTLEEPPRTRSLSFALRRRTKFRKPFCPAACVSISGLWASKNWRRLWATY